MLKNSQDYELKCINGMYSLDYELEYSEKAKEVEILEKKESNLSFGPSKDFMLDTDDIGEIIDKIKVPAGFKMKQQFISDDDMTATVIYKNKLKQVICIDIKVYNHGIDYSGSTFKQPKKKKQMKKDMKALRSSGYTQKEIANKLGVSQSYVSMLLK